MTASTATRSASRAPRTGKRRSVDAPTSFRRSAAAAARRVPPPFWVASGVIATVAVSVWYYARRRAARFACTGGMRVGHDPAGINLDSRYHDEGETERDVVDQAVWESFICSDPPAY